MVYFGDFLNTPYGIIGRREMRLLLAEAQNWRCCYCGRIMHLYEKGHGEKGDSVTIEHLVPRCTGGTDTWENCVSACQACNSARPWNCDPLEYFCYRQMIPAGPLPQYRIPEEPPERKVVPRVIPPIEAPPMPAVERYLAQVSQHYTLRDLRRQSA